MMSTELNGVPIGIVSDAAWRELQREIWKNGVNRQHAMSEREILRMPWIAEMRPPASWYECVLGMMTTMSELGYVYQREYKFAYLTARAYGIPVEEHEWGRIYRAPGWPELHLYKLGPGKCRYATWVPAQVHASAKVEYTHDLPRNTPFRQP